LRAHPATYLVARMRFWVTPIETIAGGVVRQKECYRP
jgi:hypothetical protein